MYSGHGRGLVTCPPEPQVIDQHTLAGAFACSTKQQVPGWASNWHWFTQRQISPNRSRLSLSQSVLLDWHKNKKKLPNGVFWRIIQEAQRNFLAVLKLTTLMYSNTPPLPHHPPPSLLPPVARASKMQPAAKPFNMQLLPALSGSWYGKEMWLPASCRCGFARWRRYAVVAPQPVRASTSCSLGIQTHSYLRH